MWVASLNPELDLALLVLEFREKTPKGNLEGDSRT
jgi:hypothetical protein